MKVALRFQQLFILLSQVNGPARSGGIRGGSAVVQGAGICPLNGSTAGHMRAFS